jgi:ribosomal protein S1
MTTEIGNPDLMDVFEDYDFRNRKLTKEYQELTKLYNVETIAIPKVGQVVNARYIGNQCDFYVFSVPGFKDDIRVNINNSETKYLKNLNVNDTTELLIMEISKPFMIKGSVAGLYEIMAHDQLKNLEEEAVKIEVLGLNPAGYDVEIIRGKVTLPGFMPNTLAGINKLYDPNSIIGETMDVMIESYDNKEGTYIVSRRKYLQTLIPNAIKELEYGEVYSGSVTGTTKFGIFVEFNECLTGMVHKTNVNSEWTDRLDEITPGFKIEFYIKEIIKDKIILTQSLKESLWDDIRNGQILDGVVKDNKSFGSLISLDEETMGLIHISELDKSGKKLRPGQDIKVRVLSVDRMSRKIFLTID